MNINLKNYQEKAVLELTDSFKKLLLNNEKDKVCVFQAPTGSGKTLMTAKFIEEIIRELPEMDLCFIWASPGKGELHLQSKHSLEKIFGGSPRVSLAQEEFTGARERIVRNEVMVVNWEKLWSKDSETQEWKVILMKDGEKINLREVWQKTREQRKIILIIDESQIGSNAERINELRKEIGAEVTLEMSATPTINFSRADEALGKAAFVLVDPKDVIDEGMIKKELIINENIDQISDEEKDSQEVVLEAAYQKRLELEKLFTKEKSNINPLVLIQIPTAEAGEDKIKAIKKFLSDKGITEQKEGKGNGKLAIWLAEQKSETLDWVSEPDNEIEFLIFKQAIDTGWDCPRAHILVKFRETHSETFEIQTVGRILRMPEQRHYENEDLNRGYIYTNVQSIIVKKEDYNPNIIKHLKAERRSVYTPLEFTSYYKSRADYGDVTSSFVPVFENTACEYFELDHNHTFYDENIKKIKSKGVILDIHKYQEEIIANASIQGKTFDEIEGKLKSLDFARLTIAGNDLQALFEQVIKDNLGSFQNIKRSVPAVKTAIYSWFEKWLGARKWPEEITLVQKAFLYDANRQTFEKILQDAIDKYKVIREKEINERIKQSEQWYKYELPNEFFYNQHTDVLHYYDNYIFDPCYLNSDRSQPEKNFEDFLMNNKDKISWWWKNGENKKDFFGIKYEYPTNEIHIFYPDYLIQLEDGRLGIFETKDIGDRDGGAATKAKAEKLYDYIKQKNSEGKKLFGGIAIQKGNLWLLNQKKIYDWDKCINDDWSDWETLQLQ